MDEGRRAGRIEVTVCRHEMGRQLIAAVDAGCPAARPDERQKGAPESGHADAVDVDDTPLQGTAGGARIARRIRQVRPHLGTRVVVVVAVDPVDADAPVQQRRRDNVQRLGTLDIAQQDGSLGRRRQGAEPLLHVRPVLVNVADENQGHTRSSR